MIVLLAIVIYLAIAAPASVWLGRRLRKNRKLALRTPVERVDEDEQLDITPALRRSR